MFLENSAFFMFCIRKKGSALSATLICMVAMTSETWRNFVAMTMQCWDAIRKASQRWGNCQHNYSTQEQIYKNKKSTQIWWLVLLSYLSVNTSHLVERVVDSGSRVRGHRSYERTFISVGHFIRTGATPANIHDVETWLHATSKIVVGNSSMLESQNDDSSVKAKMTHWLLWGKSSRCCIVTKGWLRASTGAILSSASISNIFFSRPTNSLRSAFSASKSLPSIFITKFTWKIF